MRSMSSMKSAKVSLYVFGLVTGLALVTMSAYANESTPEKDYYDLCELRAGKAALDIQQISFPDADLKLSYARALPRIQTGNTSPKNQSFQILVENKTRSTPDTAYITAFFVKVPTYDASNGEGICQVDELLRAHTWDVPRVSIKPYRPPLVKQN